jgi:hypothetical protein
MDASQLPDAVVDQEINDFYLYKMPQELSTYKLYSWYEFNTIPNQDVYPVNQDYIVVEPPVYCSGWPVSFYQDPTQFYAVFNQVKARQNLAQGNGGTNYSFTMTYAPYVRGTVMISSGFESFNDDSLGILTSNLGGTGTVNYLTGAVTLNFFVAVPNTTTITAEAENYVASQPTAMLFYNQTFIVRPVPDIAYGMKIKILLRPTELIGASDEPQYREWYDLIALGTSLEIFKGRGDFDMLNPYKALYMEEVLIAQRRTLIQMSNQRTPSRYAPVQNTMWPYNLYPR